MRTTAARLLVGALTSTLLTSFIVFAPGSPAYAADDVGPSLSEALARPPDAEGPPGGSGQANQQGDFTYEYPITVPPGRRGQQPNLALRYSSSAPVHGGVAAGWSLPVPAITVDPDAGTVRPEWTHGGNSGEPRNFVGPDGGPLVKDPSLPVTEGWYDGVSPPLFMRGVGYRSLSDSSFTRFEYLGSVLTSPYWWAAYSSDGVTSYFGRKSEMPYSYTPLVSQIDHTGHELRYDYDVVGRTSGDTPTSSQPREFLLKSVGYYSPPASAGAAKQSYAKVTFDHAPPAFCGTPALLPAVGSRLDYRFGFGLLSGTRKLNTIKTWRVQSNVFVPVHEYALSYSATDNCASAATTPYRELASVQQKAYSPSIPAGLPGGLTVSPPTEFTYGKAASYVTSAEYGAEQELPNVVLPNSIETDQQFYVSGDPNCTYPFCPNPRYPNSPDKEWERRNGAQARGESVQAMFLDVNGDGRVDLLRRTGRVTLASAAPITGGCQVETWINRGSAGFVKNDGFSFSLRDAMADIPVAAPAGSDGDGELLCTLSRSFSKSSGQCPAYPGSMHQVQHAFADVDGDLLPDLISVPKASWLCEYVSTHGIPGYTGHGDQHWWSVPTRLSEAGSPTLLGLQKTWYVYRNTGSGFANTPILINAGDDDTDDKNDRDNLRYHPSPSVSGKRFMPFELSAFLDINGDGYPDSVTEDRTANTDDVRVGLSDGGVSAQRIALPADPRDQRSTGHCETGAECDENGTRFYLSGLQADVNGDGLPDMFETTDSGTKVAFNTGRGWGTDAIGATMFFSQSVADTRRMLSTTATYSELAPEPYDIPVAGTVHNRTALVDADYDGLPDVLFTGSGANAYAKLYLNGGGSFVRVRDADLANVARYLAGQLGAGGMTADYAARRDYLWQSRYQAVDINADGLLDLLREDNGTAKVRYAKLFIDGTDEHKAPARLLRTVRNGYGAQTTITYGRITAARRWVVTEVRTAPGAGQPDLIQRYAYKLGAQFTDDPYGRRMYRGVGEIRVLRVGDPAYAGDDLTTVQIYSYADDYRGVLTRTVTVLGDSAFTSTAGFNPATQNGVMSVVDHTYEFHALGLPRAPGMVASFAPKVTLPTGQVRYACLSSSGQTADNCVASGISVRESTTWEPLTRSNKFVAKAPTRTQTTFTNADGQAEVRATARSYHLAWSPTVFHLAPASTAQSVTVDGQEAVLGGVQYTYADAEFFYPATSKVTDPSSADRVTRYAFFTGGVETGQPRYVWAPEQIRRYGLGATANRATQFSYDPHGVYATKLVDPAGHTRLFTTDLGTGALLSAQGPDYVCPDDGDADAFPEAPSACSIESTGANLREELRTVVDGLGRPLSLVAHAMGSASAEVERYTYHDSGSPVSRTVERRSGDGVFGSQTTEVDGLGRTVKTSTSQAPQPTREVTYDYDARGFLKDAVFPRADAAGNTGIRRLYDALGRVTSVAETVSGTHIFQMHFYHGLTHLVRQWPDGDGARQSEKTSVLDALGQLVEVQERSGTREDGEDTIPVYAHTRYRYDGLGRLASMTDPDNVLTTMTHDYVGNRRAISSAGRTWSYAYDHNSNLTSVVEPVPAGASQAAYTHTMAYDEVDRVVLTTPAHRDLTPAERTEFKHGPTEYHYDQAHPSVPDSGTSRLYQIGRLSYTTSPVATVTNEYDPYGLPARTLQRLTALDGLIQADDLRLTTEREPGTGRVENQKLEAFADGYGSALTFEGSSIFYGFDADGTPRRVYASVGSAFLNIADQTRNAAGVVTKREANTGSLTGYAKPVVNFGYDRFSRVTSTQSMLGTTQLYKLNQSYWSNEEVRQVRVQPGGTTAPVSTMDYQYDHRMQVTQATETGGTGYQGSFSYTRGGRVASANVQATGGVRVPVRNVTHVYQDPTQPGGDAQRLAALRRPDQSDLAAYTYDEAGNMTSRTLPNGVAVTQRWDGGNLRRVSTPDGSEVSFYDGGTRVAAVRYNAAGTLVEARRWFGTAEVVYTPGQQTQYRQYVHLGGEVVARVDGARVTAVVEHYVTDPRGNHVLSLAATNGGVQRRATYGPFGEVLTESRATGTPSNKYGKEFNGEDYDPTGGLHYYGARHYDPLALQWTSADPKYRFTPDANLSEPRRANLYTFTLNNPVSLVDPDGLDTAKSDDFQDNYGESRRGEGSKWVKVTGPRAKGSLKGSVESDGRAGVRLFTGEVSALDVANGFLVGKISPAELGLQIQNGVLLPYLKWAALSLELRAPVPITDSMAVLVYGKGSMLSVNASAMPSVAFLEGQAGLGWRQGGVDSIGYIGGQFLGTRPVYFGFQVDGREFAFDLGNYTYPVGEAVGEGLFYVTHPSRPGGDGWFDRFGSWLRSCDCQITWQMDDRLQPVEWR